MNLIDCNHMIYNLRNIHHKMFLCFSSEMRCNFTTKREGTVENTPVSCETTAQSGF